MAAAVDDPTAKVYRDSFPFDRYVPHAEFAAHVADLDELVTGIGWVVEKDDHKLTFELRETTEWELRDRCAELELDLRSRGIEWSPDHKRIDESNILRLEYRVPDEAGPVHASWVAEQLGQKLVDLGVDKERLSWRVP
jgi:hypothetical protein